MEDESVYPSFRQSLLVTISLCLTLLCVSLDETVLATAIPRITDQFHSLNDVGWYGSSYLFVFTATQMAWGKMYTMYPAKWVFLIGVAIFEIGSLVCGVSPSSGALIAGRSISGLGAGSINAGAVVIVTNTIPVRKRPIYLGCLGCVHGLVSVSGPLIGGLLTDHASWRWCFYLNLPIGAITILGIIFFLSANQPPSGHLSWREKLQSMDLLGSAFFIPGIVTLLLALEWGGSQYAWDNWRIILLFILSAILLIVFAGVQIRAPQGKATLPPRLVSNRNILGLIGYIVGNSGGLFVFVYYLPIWLQAIKGFSASKSGLSILPTQLGVVIASLAGGVLVTFVGYYTPFLIISSLMAVAGAGILSSLHPSSSLASILGYQVVLSLGIGLGSQNAMVVPSVVCAPDDVVTAIAMLCFLQMLSSSVALSIGQTVFHNRLVANLHRSAPSVDPSLVEEGATLLRDRVPSELLPSVLGAYSKAVSQTFYVGVAMCALSLLGSASMQWKRVPGKKDAAEEEKEEESRDSDTPAPPATEEKTCKQ
ncbi:putative efflux pump antibiotic resistance protein [Aspergillus heteromorphus CBS 117.55]|uniref:Putative efflux pump antibiotic resistance protein n=1 Tax=Aspergillus heteromorphus CBS 117.55 TaxID=1448321 RepID=A0A317WNZ8_9EURO|nr:putative efflux pump antibiotic resistance protein [Aspergillus heteromorphus CBS 117.55]PWY88166.1 putative efflux pump antibiotic resistance protein [Aspergillus heteromorphus CBS 117.55]